MYGAENAVVTLFLKLNATHIPELLRMLVSSLKLYLQVTYYKAT